MDGEIPTINCVVPNLAWCASEDFRISLGSVLSLSFSFGLVWFLHVIGNCGGM